jgi:hypothetical protein
MPAPGDKYCCAHWLAGSRAVITNAVLIADGGAHVFEVETLAFD